MKNYPNVNRPRPSHSAGPKKAKGGKHDAFPEKCPNWPKAPGKSGPDRSNGVRKAKIYPKSEGL